MAVASRSWLVALALVGLAIGSPGCGVAGDDDEDVSSADEEVASSSEAITGGAKVGATLRTTTGLNLRAGASTSHAILLTMPGGATVTVRQAAPVNNFYAVRYGNRDGWAHGAYLTTASSSGASPGGGGGAAVRISGPAVRPHVQSFANAACARYGCPFDVGTRNGHDPSGDRAIDMMMAGIGTRPSDPSRGTNIANFAIASDATHKVYYAIWQQRINTIDGRGWRFMEDRGSITQNHYDHVHVSFDP